jgi:energy-coupling factor transport system substrate-specific component
MAHRQLAVLHNILRLTSVWRISPATISIAVASIVGVGAFLFPFLLPAIEPVPESRARASDAPLLFAVVTVLCLAAILFELRPGASGEGLQQAAKTTALLGVLVSVDATLRLVPTFLGASPVFPLMLLTGAVFGAAFGFQMGALTLLVSAFITGGIGPWLPFQMLVAGWVGMSAGLVPRYLSPRYRLAALAGLGAFWGFGFGAIMNLWTWPFMAPGIEGDAGLYWSPGLSLGETLRHYGQFYLVTSLWYDAFRAVGNAALILVVGGPVLRTLERYRDRFIWRPWVDLDDAGIPSTRPTRMCDTPSPAVPSPQE